MDRVNLQTLIDATPSGETLTLQRGEYEGPVTIRSDITIDGRQSTIWSRSGPVVSVCVDGVCLRDLSIEATVGDAGSNSDAGVALKIADGTQAQLENVSVVGGVLGLDNEAGDWLLPKSLHLGTFAARKVNTYIVRLCAPVPCQLSTRVSGLSMNPVSLKPGLNEVKVSLRDVLSDTLICGKIDVRSAYVVRTISVTGSTIGASDADAASDVLLWEPQSLPAPQEPCSPAQPAPVGSPADVPVIEPSQPYVAIGPVPEEDELSGQPVVYVAIAGLPDGSGAAHDTEAPKCTTLEDAFGH